MRPPNMTTLPFSSKPSRGSHGMRRSDVGDLPPFQATLVPNPCLRLRVELVTVLFSFPKTTKEYHFHMRTSMIEDGTGSLPTETCDDADVTSSHVPDAFLFGNTRVFERDVLPTPPNLTNFTGRRRRGRLRQRIELVVANTKWHLPVGRFCAPPSSTCSPASSGSKIHVVATWPL